MQSLAADVSRLAENARAVLAAPLSEGQIRGLGDDALLDAARAAEEYGRLADALRVTIAGEVGHRSRTELGSERLSAKRGCSTPAELLERVALVAASTARARIRAAAPLRHRTALTGETLPPRFPEIATALASGAMGVDAAAALVDTLGPLSERCAPHDLAAAEAALVTAAIGDAASPPRTPDEVRIMAQTWALVLDPDGTLPDEAKGLRRRGITIGREREGTVPLRAELLPDVAAQLQRLFDAFLNPRVDAPVRPVFTPSGGASDHASDQDDEEHEAAVLAELRDPRSHTQKRHDALAGILSVAARDERTPSLGGAAPVLIVTMTAADVASDDGVGFIEGTDTVVPSAFARSIACTGAVQRLVTDARGRIVELGSPLRTFNAHQRRAIAQRDGGCVIPGCHVGATWCEVHHVHEWARGGPTHTDNGVLLCWFHHRTIDSAGWQIAMFDGMPHIKAPRHVDPYGRWRPASGSLHRRRDALRANRAGP